ncbi:Spec2 [Carabus blaptoides fortunei]
MLRYYSHIGSTVCKKHITNKYGSSSRFRKRHRIRIDRSMIGEPIAESFKHTGHIGSRDGELPDDQLTALRMQMMSKGGYDTAYKVC